MSLLDFTWTDLYVTAAPETSWYREQAGDRDRRTIDPSYFSELSRFRSELLARKMNAPFRIEWGDNRERLRIKPLTTTQIEPLFICRRYKAKPKSLLQLGFPPPVVSWLLEKKLDPGLYMFLGNQGAGKTTAASALVMEQITIHGGMAATVEMPAEMELEGWHGRGTILQTEVEDEEDMGIACRGLLRTGANLLFAGEVTRDSAAREVAEIAGAGNPVVFTYHANNALTGLRRYSNSAGGNHDMLAEVLKAVFFLTLEHFDQTKPQPFAKATLPGAAAPPERLLTVAPLVMTKEARPMIVSNLRSGTFQQLEGEMKRQRDAFMRGEIPR